MIRHYCRRCELKWYETDGGSGHVHDYTYRTDTVYPTCINAGYTEHFCACGGATVMAIFLRWGTIMSMVSAHAAGTPRAAVTAAQAVPPSLITTWTPDAGTTRASTMPLRTA